MATRSGGKQRKFGRNSTYCKVYRASGRRERNKAIKAKRHVNRMLKQVRKQERRGQPLGVEVFCLLDYVKTHSKDDSMAIEAKARLEYVRTREQVTKNGVV